MFKLVSIYRPLAKVGVEGKLSKSDRDGVSHPTLPLRLPLETVGDRKPEGFRSIPS